MKLKNSLTPYPVLSSGDDYLNVSFNVELSSNPTTDGVFIAIKFDLNDEALLKLVEEGNSLDNGLMESFFGIMKTEMFYGQENNYKNIEELRKSIEEYIDYYNNKRIKVKLKGLTPAKYRNQSLLINN